MATKTETFTPGPWTFGGNTWTKDGIVSAQGDAIARISGAGKEADANGRLIAAAPDLYRIIERLVRADILVDETTGEPNEDIIGLVAELQGAAIAVLQRVDARA